jgi:hypothetical protein
LRFTDQLIISAAQNSVFDLIRAPSSSSFRAFEQAVKEAAPPLTCLSVSSNREPERFSDAMSSSSSGGSGSSSRFAAWKVGGKYNPEKLLGKGSYGEVAQGTDSR